MLQRILMSLISQLKSAWNKIVAVLNADVVGAVKQFLSKLKGVFVSEKKPASTSTSEKASKPQGPKNPPKGGKGKKIG